VPQYSYEEKRDAVMREVKYRKRVYERRVHEGSMSSDFADYQIGIMLAILDDYQKLVDKDRLL